MHPHRDKRYGRSGVSLQGLITDPTESGDGADGR